MLWHIRCRCKIQYISKFTEALRGSPCDSMAFFDIYYQLLSSTFFFVFDSFWTQRFNWKLAVKMVVCESVAVTDFSVLRCC